MPQRNNIRYIVVHSTFTKALLPNQVTWPYHYLIARNGKLVSVHPVKAQDGCIDLAWVGGMLPDNHTGDNRTAAQCETLFNTLVALAEQYPDARIMGAEKLYREPDPGFDVTDWIKHYIPPVVRAA